MHRRRSGSILPSLTARRGKHRIALAHPTTLTFRDGGIEAKSLLLALDRGRLAVDGRLGKTLDVSLRAQSVPLSVSEIVMPKLGLSGTLNGDAKITGTAKAPTGTWKLRIDKLVTRADPRQRPAADHHRRIRPARRSPHQPRRHHPRRRRRHAHAPRAQCRSTATGWTSPCAGRSISAPSIKPCPRADASSPARRRSTCACAAAWRGRRSTAPRPSATAAIATPASACA